MLGGFQVFVSGVALVAVTLAGASTAARIVLPAVITNLSATEPGQISRQRSLQSQTHLRYFAKS